MNYQRQRNYSNGKITRIKVLHLIDSGGLYGAEKMLLALVRQQLIQGMDPLILSVGEPEVPTKEIESACYSEGLPILVRRMKPGLNLKEGEAILSWASDEGYNLIHSHGYKFNILFGLLPKKHKALRFVYTIHGYTANRVFSKLFLYKILDILLSFRADRVAVVSAKLKHQLLSKRNVSHIPNGIELDRKKIESKLSPESVGGRFIVSVGRLSREKAIDKAIEAFFCVSCLHPDLNFVIVGDGPEKDRLIMLANDFGLWNRVFFEGYKSSTAPYIDAAELLFISSVTEGLPLTLLEAMSLKTTVVSTSVGEIPNVLEYGELGYLVEPNDVVSMVDGLTLAIDNPRVSLSKADRAYSKLKAEFTADKMAARYLEIYREVLSE